MPDRDSFTQKPVLKLGNYRHYKGGEYEVLTLACNEATHEWLVVYKALYDTQGFPDVWVRTYDDFTATVRYNNESVSRFTPIAN